MNFFDNFKSIKVNKKEHNFLFFFKKSIRYFQENYLTFCGLIGVLFFTTFAMKVTPILNMFGGLILFFVIYPCLIASVFLAAQKLENGEVLYFEIIKEGFRKIAQLFILHILQLFYLSVYFILIIYGFLIHIMDITQMVNPSGTMADKLMLLVAILPALYLSITWLFAIPFTLFYDKNPVRALRLSNDTIAQSGWKFFLVLAFIFLTNLAFFSLFQIGLFISIPIGVIMIYLLFKEVMVINEF